MISSGYPFVIRFRCPRGGEKHDRDIDIVRAWKDEAYRRRLSAAERDQLPPRPAGLVELVDEELDTAVAGEELRTQ